MAGKAPFSVGEFDSSDTLDLGNLGKSAEPETPKPALPTETVEAPKEPKPPKKTASEVAKSTLRKQKAKRTEQPKYVSVHVSAELDRRLKILHIDTGKSRQEMGVEALEEYCKKMEAKT